MRAPEVSTLEVPLDEIVAEGNIREFAGNDEHAKSLLQSVRAVGILEPLLLTPLVKGERNNGYRYKLVAGFRRYTAACQAELRNVPARVLKGLSSAEVLEIRLTENLQRLDMNPIEQARALRDYMAASGCTQDVAGRKMGRTGSWVSSRIGLLRLPEEVQAMIALGKLPLDLGIALIPHAERPRVQLVQLARRGVVSPNRGSFQRVLDDATSGRAPLQLAGRRGALAGTLACSCACACCLNGRHRSAQ
jgi:ParB family chromosome partitioning protein